MAHGGDEGPGVQELSRSDPGGPGISRQRCGRGFRYFSAASEPITDPATRARIKALVIPPAWQEVWICPDPGGHMQAIGTDAAGRRQYLYHERWREEQDRAKFDRMVEFGRALPRLRRTVLDRLEGRGLHRDRVLAAAVRLMDLGFFRAGGEEYAADHGTFGLATIRREHVTCGRRELTFEYPAKCGIQREQAVADEQLRAVVRSLKRRSWGGRELLAWRTGTGGHDVTAADINDYLREISGADFTAKDFRTWNATVLAAVGLAVSGDAESDRAQAARDHAGRPRGGGLPRQHPRRGPRFLYRPPRHRALRGRHHHRPRAGQPRRLQPVRRAGHPGPRRNRRAAHPGGIGRTPGRAG